MEREKLDHPAYEAALEDLSITPEEASKINKEEYVQPAKETTSTEHELAMDKSEAGVTSAEESAERAERFKKNEVLESVVSEFFKTNNIKEGNFIFISFSDGERQKFKLRSIDLLGISVLAVPINYIPKENDKIDQSEEDNSTKYKFSFDEIESIENYNGKKLKISNLDEITK